MICKADVCLQTISVFCKQLMVCRYHLIQILFSIQAYRMHFRILFYEYKLLLKTKDLFYRIIDKLDGLPSHCHRPTEYRLQIDIVKYLFHFFLNIGILAYRQTSNHLSYINNID